MLSCFPFVRFRSSVRTIERTRRELPYATRRNTLAMIIPRSEEEKMERTLFERRELEVPDQ